MQTLRLCRLRQFADSADSERWQMTQTSPRLPEDANSQNVEFPSICRLEVCKPLKSVNSQKLWPGHAKVALPAMGLSLTSEAVVLAPRRKMHATVAAHASDPVLRCLRARMRVTLRPTGGRSKHILGCVSGVFRRAIFPRRSLAG